MSSSPIETTKVSLKVTNSKSLNTEIPEAQISQYTIRVLGDDIVIPIEKTISGRAAKLSLDAIPVGENRTIIVEAINSNNDVIKRGVKSGISIEPGVFTQINLVMKVVPIFIGLKDGNIIRRRGGEFLILGEQNSSLIVGQLINEKCQPFLNLLNQEYFLNTEANDGVFHHQPELLDEGKYTFCTQDKNSLEMTTKTASISDKTVRPGLSLTPAGNLFMGSDNTIIRSSQFNHQMTRDQSEESDYLLMSIFQALMGREE